MADNKPIKIREPVQWFAERMEERLKRHDEDLGERGWLECGLEDLFNGLRDEVEELDWALHVGKWDAEDVIYEAADVANRVMMIADLFRQIK